jgi:hypothetical protein
MKPADQAQAAFLNEAGVTITKTHLTLPGQTFELSKLVVVRIERTPPNPLVALFKRRPTFRLLVSTSNEAAPKSVFETQDASFIQRFQTAMNRAAAGAGGKRTR